MLYSRPNIFVKKYGGWGPFLIRVATGFHLAYGMIDNIINRERMQAFIKYLYELGVSIPTLTAYSSAYVQFIGGILFILGYYQRTSAFVMMVHFIFVILIAHVGDTYQHLFPVLFMLIASTSLFFSGPGKFAIDNLKRKRKN